MGIAERQNAIIEQFSRLAEWEDRYKHIIGIGKELKPLPPQFKSDDFKVRGCQSQVWLHAYLNDEKKVIFEADSDALIVKGLAAILIQAYSNSTPDEILASSADFLKKMGLENHLSPSRANGLYSMLKQFMYYAAAFQTILRQELA